jgi:myo-inositol 2-dehydrogenase/D-chiro-inositol 1-dehydrogenase
MSETSSSNLRIGLLGTGRIGAMHADLIQHQVAGAEVAGVFDVVSEAATKVGAAIGAPVFGTAEALITSPEVDAIAIATSTDTHVDMMIAGAEAGKAIFCEKPISLDLDKVDQALAAVATAGVPLQIGFNRRFDAGHAAVRQAVTDGTVGELRQVRITSRDPEPPPIEYVKVSGGIFCDMTIHDFDMARFVTGSEVVEVYAKGDCLVDPAIGAEGDYDTVVVVLTHENGTVTTIDNCRQAAYGYDQRVEAFGSAGVSMSQNHLDNYTLNRTAAGGHTAKVPYFFLDRYIPSYLNQWRAFVDAISGGQPVPVTGADGRAPLVMGMAAQRSVQENRPVPLSEFD